MTCGKLGALLVVDAHCRIESAFLRLDRVDADNWHVYGFELFDFAAVDVEGDDDYGIDVAADRQHVEEFAAFFDAGHLVDGDVVALVVEDLVQTFDDG